VALGRTVAGEIVRRAVPLPAPLRRGAAAVVVTGGALSLVGVAATVPLQTDPGVVTAAAVLPTGGSASPQPATDAADGVPLTNLVPVDGSAVERVDAANLVKAVQLAERQLTGGRAAAAVTVPAPPPADAGADGADAAPPTGADTAGPEGTGQSEPDGAEQTAKQKDATAPAAGSSTCELDTSGLGKVRSHVRAAARFLGCRFGEPDMFGVAGRGGTSDHPSGKALDFMVDKVTGNALAACALRNQDELGITYVIWRQRINFGEGWQPMSDRGGATANHFDHVHVSFGSGAGSGPRAC
jgi:hypothetical protein